MQLASGVCGRCLPDFLSHASRGEDAGMQEEKGEEKRVWTACVQGVVYYFVI